MQTRINIRTGAAQIADIFAAFDDFEDLDLAETRPETPAVRQEPHVEQLVGAGQNAGWLASLVEVQQLRAYLESKLGKPSLLSRITSKLFGERVGVKLTDQVCVTRSGIGIVRVTERGHRKELGNWTNKIVRKTSIRPASRVADIDAALQGAKRVRDIYLETGRVPDEFLVRAGTTRWEEKGW